MNDHTWPTFLALWNQFDQLAKTEKKIRHKPTLKQALEFAHSKSQIAARSRVCACPLHPQDQRSVPGIYCGLDQSIIREALRDAKTKACLFLILRWKFEHMLGRISNGRRGLSSSKFNITIDNIQVLELRYKDALPFLHYVNNASNASAKQKPSEGFEPSTSSLEGLRSIQLS